MEIQGDRTLDPLSRRRQAEAARGQRAGAPASAAAAKPDASYTAGDAASVARLVQILRSANPADLQRIDELKQRIADGSYRADPEELANLLLGQQG